MESSFDELLNSSDEFIPNESIFDLAEPSQSSQEKQIYFQDNEQNDEIWTSQAEATKGSPENPSDSLTDGDMNNNNDMAINENNRIPVHIRKTAQKVRASLLPKKSKPSYMSAYNNFKIWMEKNNINLNSIDQDVMLTYFEELKEKYKPTSLWSTYSKLRSTISNEHNINIHNFSQLIQFLKNEKKGYVSVQALALTEEEVRTFLETAPDEIYLDTKVVWILGMYGACRRCELKQLEITDVQNKGDDLLVCLNHTKTDRPRSFIIPPPLCTTVKKYMALRPKNYPRTEFFINYANGKCTRQPIGINKIGGMAKEVAIFLQLPKAHRYTSHCIRHTSATCFANTGASDVQLKQLGDWQSTEIAHSYVQNSLFNKRKIAQRVTDGIYSTPSTSTSAAYNVSTNVPSFTSTKFNTLLNKPNTTTSAVYNVSTNVPSFTSTKFNTRLNKPSTTTSAACGVATDVPSFTFTKLKNLNNPVSTTAAAHSSPSTSSAHRLQNTEKTNSNQSSTSAAFVIEDKENLTLSDLLQNFKSAKNINFNFTNCPNLSIYLGTKEN